MIKAQIFNKDAAEWGSRTPTTWWKSEMIDYGCEKDGQGG